MSGPAVQQVMQYSINTALEVCARIGATHWSADELKVAEGGSKAKQMLVFRVDKDLPVSFQAVELGKAHRARQEVQHILYIW